MKVNFETILSLILGGIGLMFGTDKEIQRIVFALLIAIGFDTLTGVIKARYKKNITSQKWIDGFIRKILMLVAVSFCYFLDSFHIINVGVSLESASAMFFIAGEVISVFENLTEMGLPLPKVIIDYLGNATAPSNSNKPVDITNMLVVNRTPVNEPIQVNKEGVNNGN